MHCSLYCLLVTIAELPWIETRPADGHGPEGTILRAKVDVVGRPEDDFSCPLRKFSCSFAELLPSFLLQHILALKDIK